MANSVWRVKVSAIGYKPSAIRSLWSAVCGRRSLRYAFHKLVREFRRVFPLLIENDAMS